MSEHHPERMSDMEFITARADMALTAYCDAVAQGFNHLEAERIASEVLFSGLHFQSTIPLFLSWRTSLRGNFLHRSRERFRLYTVVEQGCSSHIRQVRFDGHWLLTTIRPSLHRTDRHDSAAHREQQSANNRTDGGSKPKGVVGKGTRKAPEAVSYRAKVQRQPNLP